MQAKVAHRSSRPERIRERRWAVDLDPESFGWQANPNSNLTLRLAGVAFSSPTANFSPEQSISPNNRSSTSSTAFRCDASATWV